MKDELVGQIMKKIAWFRAKAYNYLKENNNRDKKSKGAKMCVIKIKLKFRDYKICSEAAQIENKINYLENSKIVGDSLKEDQKDVVCKKEEIKCSNNILKQYKNV